MSAQLYRGGVCEIKNFPQFLATEIGFRSTQLKIHIMKIVGRAGRATRPFPFLALAFARRGRRNIKYGTKMIFICVNRRVRSNMSQSAGGIGNHINVYDLHQRRPSYVQSGCRFWQMYFTRFWVFFRSVKHEDHEQSLPTTERCARMFDAV